MYEPPKVLGKRRSVGRLIYNVYDVQWQESIGAGHNDMLLTKVQSTDHEEYKLIKKKIIILITR